MPKFSAGLVSIAAALFISAGLAIAVPVNRGTIELTVTDPVGQPIAGFQICPYAGHTPKAAKIGECGTTNAEGTVTLKRVTAGSVYVARSIGGHPAFFDFHKILVHAGRTTNARWTNAGS